MPNPTCSADPSFAQFEAKPETSGLKALLRRNVEPSGRGSCLARPGYPDSTFTTAPKPRPSLIGRRCGRYSAIAFIPAAATGAQSLQDVAHALEVIRDLSNGLGQLPTIGINL